MYLWLVSLFDSKEYVDDSKVCHLKVAKGIDYVIKQLKTNAVVPLGLKKYSTLPIIAVII